MVYTINGHKLLLSMETGQFFTDLTEKHKKILYSRKKIRYNRVRWLVAVGVRTVCSDAKPRIFHSHHSTT